MMHKILSTLTPAALLLLTLANGAQAASNTTVQITGSVVAATCDVSSSATNLDLGNYTPSEFTTVATPITGSMQQFSVSLTNCQNPLKSGDTANLVVAGTTLGGSTNIFNSSGTNAGVMLSQASSPTVFINAGDKLLVSTATEITNSTDFNGKSLSFIAGLASSSSKNGVNIGTVSAPITFQFVYN